MITTRTRKTEARKKRVKAELTQKADTSRYNSVIDVLEDLGFSPAEALAQVARKGLQLSDDETFNPSDRASFANMAARASAELLQYIQPKLNRTEVSGPGGSVPTFQVVLNASGSTPETADSVHDEGN